MKMFIFPFPFFLSSLFFAPAVTSVIDFFLALPTRAECFTYLLSLSRWGIYLWESTKRKVLVTSYDATIKGGQVGGQT
jgi:hypothetical protein